MPDDLDIDWPAQPNRFTAGPTGNWLVLSVQTYRTPCLVDVRRGDGTTKQVVLIGHYDQSSMGHRYSFVDVKDHPQFAGRNSPRTARRPQRSQPAVQVQVQAQVTTGERMLMIGDLAAGAHTRRTHGFSGVPDVASCSTPSQRAVVSTVAIDDQAITIYNSSDVMARDVRVYLSRSTPILTSPNRLNTRTIGDTPPFGISDGEDRALRAQLAQAPAPTATSSKRPEPPLSPSIETEAEMMDARFSLLELYDEPKGKP